tara:strand:+ start:1519 stop:1926 length:408 start_codon:yes stop_codon:yes gene_type:complete
MGLDMYAFRHKGDMIQPQEKRDKLDGTPREPIQFADWRKHNRLQGFMQELYDKKNGADADNFNCVPLYLSKEELDMLQKQIETRTLPQTEGFFFGDDSYTWEGEQNDMKAYDLKFVKDAKDWLDKGYKVFYECWW